MINKKIKPLFLALSMLTLTTGVSCGEITSGSYSSTASSEEETVECGVFTEDDYLKVNGTDVRREKGEGDAVILRGTNAGGYLVIEQWMTALKGSDATGYLDHKTVTEIFVERFGEETTLELWEYYRENYWTELDFQNCADMGMNVIRLPFTYMNVDPDYCNVPEKEGEEFNFDVLDDFVETAAEYGIYTILDMHGAYGSQNGQDHSGEQMSSADEVDFYSNEEKQEKTVHLWEALTEHYKGNPAVAGFDILNEPAEKAGTTTTRHWEFFDKVNDAVRAVDEDRILIFESCWDGANLPQPSVYGWENCMYSFHHYTGSSDAATHVSSFQSKITDVNNQNFGVPIYMGEFTCYGNQTSWESTLSLLNSYGWHWTTWTYKLNRNSDTSYPGWGIYYSRAEKVVPDEDDLETIYDKWYMIDTSYIDTEEMMFDEVTSLYGIMKMYL